MKPEVGMTDSIVAVIGNPNCGKTTLFNALTGSNQSVGNWSGVTVEKKHGFVQLPNKYIELIDLPGTYSLEILDDSLSVDESIARQFACSNEADLIINIIDATKLERGLYLTTQLLEMRVPVLVVLNMTDVAEREGISIETEALAHGLGCPVVAIVASKQRGINQLKTAIEEQLDNKTISEKHPTFNKALEVAISEVQVLEATTLTRWDALNILEGDLNTLSRISEKSQAIALELSESLQGTDFDMAKSEGRYQFIHQATEKSLSTQGNTSSTLTEKIDAIVLNRWAGVPIFFGVMYLMFLFAVNLGAAFIDFFDIAVGALLIDGVGNLLTDLGMPSIVRTLVADGFGGGIQLVATFIPVIGFLYLFLSIIEDSGYIARAAFVLDRLMRFIGLPGKSFVPLIVGFGCNVPAVMAARTMETEKDRLLTVAMAPFMSCGARLSVYALFAAAFFAKDGQNVVFLLYFTGIAMAVFTGFVLKKTLFATSLTPFVMEMPTYHIPSFSSILHKTWHRLKSFIKRAGKTIVVVFIVLKMLSTIGVDGSVGNDDTENSLLSNIGQVITPVFAPIGVQQDNWPATVGIFTGVFAKEAVVGTLDALYSSTLSESDATGDEEAQPTLSENLIAAWETIPANISDMLQNLGDPLGLGSTDIESVEKAAEDQEVNISTFTAMVKLFGSDLAAFSYLVFVLLYTPCVAVMGAMLRESGVRWMAFVSIWATGLAYISASVVYQVGSFQEHPEFSTWWLAGCAVVSLGAFIAMRVYGSRLRKNSLVIPVVNIQ